MAKRRLNFLGLLIFSRENKPFKLFFQGPGRLSEFEDPYKTSDSNGIWSNWVATDFHDLLAPNFAPANRQGKWDPGYFREI